MFYEEIVFCFFLSCSLAAVCGLQSFWMDIKARAGKLAVVSQLGHSTGELLVFSLLAQW